MKTRYSKTTGAFYPLDIEYKELPADIQEVNLSDYHAAMNRPADHSFSFDAAGVLTITPPAPATLDELKAAKNAEINAARLAANQTTFTHAGKTVACDTLSRSDIDGVAGHVALFGTFPPEFPGGWKATDNSIIPLPTVDAFKAFYQSMTAQGTANFNHSQTLKAALAAATTKAKVAAITW